MLPTKMHEARAGCDGLLLSLASSGLRKVDEDVLFDGYEVCFSEAVVGLACAASGLVD